MKKLTIPEILDIVPMGGGVTIIAPFEEVARCANERNIAMQGEWYDVASSIDKKGRVVVVVHRRELWNIASPEHLMKTQRFWRRTIQEWRM